MPEAQSEKIRAGSVNLARYMDETEARAEAIADEIDSMGLDLIGCQETEEWIEAALLQKLSGDWRVASDNVNCPLLIRRDRFAVRASKSITMPGSVRKRYGSGALLERLSDGLVFAAVTIHPSNHSESPNSATDRIRQAESCWQQVGPWAVAGHPMIVLGDMNDKRMPPEGLPGVFVRRGATDVLVALGLPPRIDRAFLWGFKADRLVVNPVRNAVSDHDFVTYEIHPESTLERLLRIHGPISEFKVSSFESARASGGTSRYTAVVQDWLDLAVTCRWTSADQDRLDSWRHEEFPTWPPEDYTGPVGPTSMTRLAQVAGAAGKRTYKVVP